MIDENWLFGMFAVIIVACFGLLVYAEWFDGDDGEE